MDIDVAMPSKEQHNECTPTPLSRIAAMCFSTTSYLIGVLALVYLILFIADILVPVTVNQSSALAPDLSGPAALLWNMAVVLLWGAQHSVMARPTFKRQWTKLVPAVVERSTYLLFVALATVMLVSFWVPMPHVLWDLSGSMSGVLLLALYFTGWAIVLFATFLINHFHLFGLQQSFNFLRRKPVANAVFKTPLLYKLVRHPMMSGVLIALWSVPVMTSGRLLFNLLMTSYVFIGLYFEERNLADELGEQYRDYQRTTPAVIPGLRGSR